MRELEDVRFSDLPIDGLAVRALLRLPTLLIDLLTYLCTLQVVDSWLPQLLQKGSSFRGR